MLVEVCYHIQCIVFFYFVIYKGFYAVSLQNRTTNFTVVKLGLAKQTGYAAAFHALNMGLNDLKV